jgi:hypothetical protein
LDKNGGLDRVPIKKDLTSEVKYVLFDACIKTPSRVGNNGVTKIYMNFESITNPYSVRDTSKFIVEVYKTYDINTDTLGKKVIEYNQNIIEKDKYDPLTVSQLTYNADNLIV